MIIRWSIGAPRRHRSQRGVAAVELALVISLLALVFAGIVEFGRAFWYVNALTKATRSGARMLSLADRATFSTGSFISNAKDAVVASANAANIQPPLTPDNVEVSCMDATFTPISCDSGANAPSNVSVAITGYTIDLGKMFPFLSAEGGAKTYLGISLEPLTTMRYMN